MLEAGVTRGWSTFNMVEEDGYVHVVPNYGPEHLCSIECWCHPEPDYYHVMLHNVAQ